jgi:hypothetical protein
LWVEYSSILASPGVNGNNLRRPSVTGNHGRFQDNLEVLPARTNGIGKRS